jgi:hypothetical protein
MMNFAYPHTPEFPPHPNPWVAIERRMKFPQHQLDRLSDSVRAQVRQRNREYAEAMFAEHRRHTLYPLAERRYSPSTRWLVKIVVVSVGALSFTMGIQLLTQRLGVWAPAATVIGGGVASFCVDVLATRSLTNWKRRRLTDQQLRQLKQQAAIVLQPTYDCNELVQQYYQAQQHLLQQIEGGNRVWQVPIHAVVACLFSAIELTITITFVSRLPLLGNFPDTLKILLACLPVFLTWAISLLQSEYFEIPDYLANLIPQYNRFLRPPIDLDAAEINIWLVHRAYEEDRLDAGIQYVLEGDASLRLKTLAMAVAAYDVTYYQRQIQQLEQRRNATLLDRWQTFQRQRSQLPLQAPLPPLVEKGCSTQEIYEQRKRQHLVQQRWVEQELPKHESCFREEMLAIKADFSTNIQRHKQKLAQALQAYNLAHRQWKTLNQSVSEPDS